MTTISDSAQRNRAELVRQRRAQTTQRRSQKAESAAVRSATRPQPVTRSRYAPASAPVKSQRVRRQYYYAVGADNVEVRLPALPIVRPGWRLLSGFLVLVLAAALVVMWNFSEFQVTAVQAQGLSRVTPENLNKVLQVTGKPVVTLNTTEMTALLSRKFPELTGLRVSVGLPAVLTISASERAPILAWTYGEKTVWIDAEGVIMPVRGEAQDLLAVQSEVKPPEVLFVAPAMTEESNPDEAAAEGDAEATPVPTEAPKEKAAAPAGPKKIDAGLLEAVIRLSSVVPADSTLVFSPVNGLGWHDNRGWDVFFGIDLDNIQAKLNAYQGIVDQLAKDGITPRLVSVEYLYAPFYRTE